MQHERFSCRRLAFALILALVAGVRAAAAETVSITWDPNPEPEVIGYRVYVGGAPGVYTSQYDLGNVTTYSLGPLVAGQRYCFAVAAFFAGPTMGSRSTEVCTDVDHPPTLQAPGNQTSAVGAALTLTLVGSDPEGLPVTFSATGLPAGLTINRSTGFISGTATTVATSNVIVTASDGVLSTSQAFTWTISASLPGVATPLRPTGTIATATPMFEWESVATATSYRLWVDDASTTDPKIQLDVTPSLAGCTTAGAVCHASPGVTLAAGRASWSVRASNASGAGPWSGAMDFTVADTKVPTVSIATPTAATTYSTSADTISLGGTATDDAAVTLVTWTNNLGGSGNATGTTSWAVAALPIKIGTNVITVTARDAGGNIATDVLTVTRGDGQGPTLTVTSPEATTYSTTTATMMMQGSASDDSMVARVTWISDRGGSGTAAGTTVWVIPAIALKQGFNVIAVTAEDSLGNKTTKTVTVTASLTDGQAPTVTITSPAVSVPYSTGNDTVALAGTASDAFGVTQVSWSSDRGVTGPASGTTAWSVPTAALKPGANVITVTARDAAGNAGTARITVTMTDGAAPVVAIAAPTAAAAFATTGASIALGGTSSDAFGVTQVTWVSDKGGAGTATGTATWSVAAVALEVGVNVITVSAKDAAGHVGTDVITVTRTDGVLPTVTITAPVAATTFSTTNTTLALGGTASDNVGVAQVTWSNSKGGSGVATGTTAWSAASVSLQPGENVITITAKDAAGNAATGVLTVTLTDKVAPVIAIATPTSADKHTTTAASVTLGGTASDAFGVAEVRWANDRGGVGVAAGTTSWSATLGLMPGVNVITVTARDAAGNTSTDRISITSDGKAPTLAITTPAASSVTKADAVALSGSATDDMGVTEVTWTNNRGGNGKAAGTTAWSIASATLQPGVNVITVVAQDAGGNRTSLTVSVTRDSEAPTVAVVAPTASGTLVTNKASLALSGKATDNTGVTVVSWQSNRGGLGNAVGTTDWTVPGVTLMAGANVITVTAKDAAGNVATATLTVTLDTRAPVVSIAAPTNAASYATSNNSLVFGGTANDDVALAELTWSNNQGGSGVAVGTSAWSVPSVALKAGLNTLTITARDTAGNSTSATVAVRVTDVKAPAVRITSPSPDASFSVAVAVINLEGTSTDDFGVARTAWVNDRGGSGVAVAKADNRWIAGGLALQPGVNVITVTSADASGNASTSVARITYERGAPTISLTSPTTAATFTTSSSNVALTGVASDDTGVSRVTWSTDKGQVGDAIGTTTWTIPAITVSLGTTVVTVTAYDKSGNASSLALNIVCADTAKPSVKIYTPTTGSAITTWAPVVTVAGTATDNVGIARVTWATDRGVSGTAFGTTSWSTPAIELPSGTSVITVTSYDAAGNTSVATLTVVKMTQTLSTSSSASSSVQSASSPQTPQAAARVITPEPSVAKSGSVPASQPIAGGASSASQASPTAAQPPKSEPSVVPPVVRILAPTAAARVDTTAASVSLGGVASHASGISVVRWMTDKGDGGVAAGTSTWTVASIPVKPGTTTITVTAAAAAGGDATTAVLVVVRPDPLPKLSLSYPTVTPQWASAAATVTLKGTATDNVTRVTWSSDSGATGMASGTTTWAVANIGLQEGINRITLTAQDASGRTDRQVLTIIRTRTVSSAVAVKSAPAASAE